MAGKGIGNKDGIINKSHLYYYQIQQQAIAEVRNWCDIVVRGSNKEYCFSNRYLLLWHRGKRN